MKRLYMLEKSFLMRQGRIVMKLTQGRVGSNFPSCFAPTDINCVIISKKKTEYNANAIVVLLLTNNW